MSTPPPASPRRRRRGVEARAAASYLAFAPLLFQAAMAMRNHGILAALHEHGPLSTEDIAQRCQLPLYGALVLLEAGIDTGLVDEVEAGEDHSTGPAEQPRRWSLGDMGWWILNDSMTRVNMDFVNDVCWHGAPALAEATRSGTPAGLPSLGPWENIYQGLSSLPEPARSSWFAFDHYYSDGAFAPALDEIFSRPVGRLLDVGGNTGRFSLHCLRRDSQVQVTILDLPGQLEQAEAAVSAAGLQDRWHGVAMDLLDHQQPFPAPVDAVWMSQFLDCFGEDDIRQLLQRGAQALAEDGRLYILETCWDRQAFPAASHALRQTSLYFTVMANGSSRMYRGCDLIRLAGEAGMEVIAERDHIGYGHTLFTCRRR